MRNARTKTNTLESVTLRLVGQRGRSLPHISHIWQRCRPPQASSAVAAVTAHSIKSYRGYIRLYQVLPRLQ
jgi:hypothetical protein